MKKDDRKDKFVYTKDDIKGIKIIKPNKKVKESYKSFAEFLFEKEEKFVASTMRWITIKDERDRNQHILIKKKDGTVIAGMGGEHNGEKLKDVFDELGDKRDEIEQREQSKSRTSQLLTKAMANTKVLDKKELKKYVTDFRKKATLGPSYHISHSIRNKVNYDEYSSINAYTGSGFKTINKLLRNPDYYEKEHPEELSDSAREYYEGYIKNIHSALKNNPTKVNTVVYRGIKKTLMEKLEGIEAGDIITDDGFVSTSTSKTQADKFSQKFDGGYTMTILVPKGSQAATVKDMSHFDTENEILINKKARFEVKSIDKDAQEMIVELLPHEDD